METKMSQGRSGRVTFLARDQGDYAPRFTYMPFVLSHKHVCLSASI